MTNNTTMTQKLQVEKVRAIPWKELTERRLYLTAQGDFAQATYLDVEPRGGKGRLQSMNDTKQQVDLRRAFKRLRGIIRLNFGQNLEREAFITLTYRGSMQDTKKLQKDLEEWIRLLRKHYRNHKFDYVAVMEPHQHGGWHIHLLLKSTLPLWHANGIVGLCYNRTREMWRKANGTGEGAVRHERLDGIDDLGRYFEMYFTTAIPEDIENSGNKEAIREASKSAQKGSRLQFYPSGFKFYRTSRGIIRPKIRQEFFDDIIEEYGRPKNTIAYALTDCDNGNRVQYIQTMEFRR